MSRKRTVYPTQLKTQLVLELLKGQKRVNEIASEHNILPSRAILEYIQHNGYRFGNGSTQQCTIKL